MVKWIKKGIFLISLATLPLYHSITSLWAQDFKDIEEAKAEGYARYARADSVGAESAFRYILSRDSKRWQARMALALSLEAQEKLSEAFALWMALNAEVKATDPVILYHLGRNNLMQGRFALAEKTWIQAVRLLSSPQSDEEMALLRLTTIMLAIAQHLQKDYNGSNANLAHLASKEEVSIGLGRLLEGMNCRLLDDIACATDKIRLALKLDNTLQEGRRALADIQASYGDFDNAYLDARRYIATEADPDYEKKFKEYTARTTKPIDVLLASKESGFSTAWPRAVTADLPEPGPTLRVGLLTTAKGETQQLSAVTIMGNAPFSVILEEEGALVKSQADTPLKFFFISTPTALISILQGIKEYRAAKPLWLKTDSASTGSFLIKGARITRMTQTIQSDLQVRGHLTIIPKKEGFILVNEVGLEYYLLGVVPYEIGSSSPRETIRAQAVLARSYALWRKNVDHFHKVKEDPFDLCDQVHCQVYRGVLGETPTTTQAVKDTLGEYLKTEGQSFQIWYHASCGGMLVDDSRADAKIEDAKGELTALTPTEFTQFFEWANFLNKSPEWCFEKISRFSWMRFLPIEELIRKTNNAYPEIGVLQSVFIDERGLDGRVKKIRLSGAKGSRIIEEDFAIRQALAPGGLRSSLFSMIPIRVNKKQRYFIFLGRGYGHGRGACQTGAINQGKENIPYGKIIKFYYPKTTIEKR